MGAGRPTDLTDEVMAEIKQSVLNGETLKDFAERSQISYNTVTDWTYRNYRSLADKIEGWKRDRKLMLADSNIEKILQLPVEDKDFVRTVSDMSKFVKETLDKENYSKRTDLTTGGKELPTPILNNVYVPGDDSNQENISTTATN